MLGRNFIFNDLYDCATSCLDIDGHCLALCKRFGFCDDCFIAIIICRIIAVTENICGISCTILQEVQIELCNTSFIAHDAYIPIVPCTACHIDIMSRIAVQQNAIIPRGGQILKEILVCHMSTVYIRLIRHRLNATFKHNGLCNQMCLGNRLHSKGIAIGSHRSKVRSAYCEASKRQHTIKVCIIYTTLTARNRLTTNCVRIGSSFTGGLTGAMDVDEHMIFCGFLGQDVQELDDLLALRVKEVWLNAFNAHLCPFFDAFALFRCIQIAFVCPDNQANALTFCVIQNFLHPVIVTVIQVIAAVVYTRLPAFVQKLILPAHLCCKVNILLVQLRCGLFPCCAFRQIVMAEIAIQPSPVDRTRYDPTGIFDYAVRTQRFCKGIFCNICRITNNHETPRRGERRGRYDIAELLR